MKQVAVIIGFFCFSFVCKAQVTKGGNTYANVAYIVDGVSAQKETIKPQDVFSKDVLTGRQLTAIYDNKGLDTLTIVVTKKGAIRYYQNKLSAFSREYESYLKSNNNNDSDIHYVVHGESIESKGDERIDALYKIPPEKIIAVTFTESSRANGNGTNKVVLIETKIGE